MTTSANALTHLRRPRLLIRAARCGVMDYNRRRDLKRVLRSATLPSPSASVSMLMEREAELEATRKTDDGSYSVVRHVEVLIALMGEARLLTPTVTAA
ncbi:DUF6477 family protein [Celeribacter sp.]|uniref:DUF6477 family protein n=1 Tax=Celeribacter sp. TaxID=1890673 RepID=UPI003A95DF8E